MSYRILPLHPDGEGYPVAVGIARPDRARVGHRMPELCHLSDG